MLLFQPSGVMQVGVDNINLLLEGFMGINDTELGNCCHCTDYMVKLIPFLELVI